MTATAFEIRDATGADRAAIKHVVFSVLAEHGLVPDPAATDADLEDITGNYLETGGTFRVVQARDGTVVGCGALFPLPGNEMELRKMYLLPCARGHGVGRTLLSELIAFARARGTQVISLETAAVLEAAIKLYRSFGFVAAERRDLSPRADQAWALQLADPNGAAGHVAEPDS